MVATTSAMPSINAISEILRFILHLSDIPPDFVIRGDKLTGCLQLFLKRDERNA